VAEVRLDVEAVVRVEVERADRQRAPIVVDDRRGRRPAPDEAVDQLQTRQQQRDHRRRVERGDERLAPFARRRRGPADRFIARRFAHGTVPLG
jgi:hypothetical protein